MHDISYGLIDLSKIPTVSKKHYGTMNVERETRLAHIVLQETKDNIVEVFKTVLPQLGKKALIGKSDCAPEYNTPQLVKLLKEHGSTEW